MEQVRLNLEPWSARTRRTDPSTSQAAAARVDEFAAEHYQRILRSLELGPASIYEIAERANITHVQVARRLPELLKGQRVRLIEGLVRRSPTGRSCRVWTLA